MPLGVGSATPTAERHLASVALWREGRLFLFDCGENAQMRLLQAGMKRSKIDYILITHLDGDHFFGLPGLLSTMQLQRREKELHIVSPKGIKKFVDSFLQTAEIDLCFKIKYTEIDHKTEHQVVVEESDFFIECRNLKHNKFCVGYRFQEKDKPGRVNAQLAAELGVTEDDQFKNLKAGKDIKLADGTKVLASEIVGEPVKGNVFAYITDTEFCENCIRLAENATILYHEATFGQALKDKAVETGHCTAQEAAIVAKTANAERLVIGHFSARYTNPFVLLKEAKQVFEETWVATELRPIMTDPEQEKNIFKPVVNTASQSQQAPQRRSGGNQRYGSQGGDRRSSGFRPRQSQNRPRYDDRGSRGYSSGGRDQRNDYPTRDRNYPPRDRNFRDTRSDFVPRERRDYQPRDNREYTPRDRDYNDRRSYPPRDNRDYSSRDNREYTPRDNRDNRDYTPRDNRNNRDNRDYPRNRGDRDTQNTRPPSNNDGDNQNRGRNTSTNIPITPRTPFDEFDRF